MQPFAFSHAPTLADAARGADLTAEAMLAPSSSTLVKAGGVDLLDLMKEGLVTPSALVSLRDVPGLDRIEPSADGGLRIGAMVTLARVAADPDIRARYPALADAAGDSASPEIRNLATLGGNLLQRPRCWYFRSLADRCLRKGGGHCFAISGENQYHAIFDNRFCAIVHPSTSATALVALGASIELVDEAAATRNVALEAFFIGPDKDVQRENDLRAGEILTAIVLPSARGLRSAHVKIAQKESFDWPLVDVAVALEIGPDGLCRRAGVVLGGVAPTPYRARAVEAELVGRPFDRANAEQAASRAATGAAPLSKNGYKVELVETATRRALLRLRDA